MSRFPIAWLREVSDEDQALDQGSRTRASDAEVADLHGVIGRLDTRLLSKREVALVLLAGFSEQIVGREGRALTDEQRALPTYSDAARAVRGIWVTTRV